LEEIVEDDPMLNTIAISMMQYDFGFEDKNLPIVIACSKNEWTKG